MCGIAGFIDHRALLSRPEQLLVAMATSMKQRGPDDAGHFFDENTGVGLAHARLEVIDLSPAGHQPMVSRSGRFVISYNGEVYNFRALRVELERSGVCFHGHSDTEVLLEGIEQYGLDAMLEKCNGMFAFALWDREERAMHLVRDRLGIKPLYWWSGSAGVVFGSTLKPLAIAGMFVPELDGESVGSYLRYAAVPSPFSIFKGVNKLEPGTILSVHHGGDSLHTTTRRFWCASAAAERGVSDRLDVDEHEAAALIENTLREAVRDRMVADVPLGALLSGGIDSSLVVALMQSESTAPIHTFSIGFPDTAYDESPHARAIAQHLGTTHTELMVDAATSLAAIPSIPEHFDEPFGDSSAIPTSIVARLAREEVTVALSGDGGDELFCGYNRYHDGLKAWRCLSQLPSPARALFRGVVEAVPSHRWTQGRNLLRQLTLRDVSPVQFGERLHKLAQLSSCRDQEQFYRRIVSVWPDPAQLTSAGEHRVDAIEEPTDSRFNFAERMMLADTRSYLVDDILTKVDRASMASSLEARVPLLDHRVFELAWRLPKAIRCGSGASKPVLRNILSSHVPRALFERPKTGFALPIGAWFAGPLRPWCESLLHRESLESVGIRPEPVLAMWKEILDGRASLSNRLWVVLVLLQWLPHWQKTYNEVVR